MAPTQLLQQAINEAADHPSYAAGLPPLSEKRWMEILNNSDYTAKENDRLEFVGDALMYAALARQMYKQYPDGNPHFYTVRPFLSHCSVLLVGDGKRLVPSGRVELQRHILPYLREDGVLLR